MALIDISRSIASSTAVWPGDQSIEWKWTARLEEDESSVNLGAFCTSTHAGTHVDAPFHVTNRGGTVDELPLDVFVGPTDVVSVQESSRICPEHVRNLRTSRVLFKTPASTLSDDSWPDSITALDPDTVHVLKKQDVVLIGTDAPSVDPLESTSLKAHHALVDHGIINIEGLCLKEVPPGCYYLMAFPMNLSNADAAPVRAVLDTSYP